MAIAVCQGLPSDTTIADVAARDTYHRYFYAYTCKDCNCDPVQTETDFGCGGLCYLLPPGVRSVALQKGTLSDPKSPAATIYDGIPCQGHQQPAGVKAFTSRGCTNLNIGTSTSTLSAHLYYGC